MPSIEDIYEQAQQVVMTYTEAGLMVATAESCTGGLIAAALTDVAGSSAVLDRSFVTYSNAAKASMLGVSPDLMERVGAVSEEVALAMAQGALANSKAQVAIAVTGIAGPGGG
ncbi:MAG: CinA family protein, partial [Pseudomonadota bacterium]